MRTFIKNFKKCFAMALDVSIGLTISRIIIQIALVSFPYVGIYSVKILINELSSQDYSNKTHIFTWLTIAILVGAITKILSFCNSSLQNMHFEKITNKVTVDIISRSTRIDISFYDSPEYLNTLEVVMGDSNVINTLVWNIFNLISGIVSLIISIYMMGNSYFFYAIFLILCSFPYMFSENCFANKMYKNRLNDLLLNRKQQYLQSVCIDRAFAFDIRIYDIGSYIISKYKYLWEQCYSRRNEIRKSKLLTTSVTTLLPDIVIIILLIYLVDSIIKGEKTVGDFTLYMSLFYSLIGATENVISSLSSVYEDKLKVEAIGKIEEFPLEDERNGFIKLEEIHEIEFRNVSFRYSEELPYVLKDISFEITKNTKLCIIGINGSGKSTIIKLLLRYYDVNEGEILINSINIKEYSIESIRRLCSVVLQDSFNYAFTLRENIHLGDLRTKPPDDCEIEEKFSLIDGLNLLKKLENGNDTYIHRIFQDSGYEPSGGERQKISIAKSFHRDSELLILDEPTAALDPKSENELFSNIKKIEKNKMVIFTTHSMNFVNLADYIVVIENGKILEKGSHEKLLHNKGKYSDLYDIQKRNYIS